MSTEKVNERRGHLTSGRGGVRFVYRLPVSPTNVSTPFKRPLVDGQDLWGPKGPQCSVVSDLQGISSGRPTLNDVRGPPVPGPGD